VTWTEPDSGNTVAHVQDFENGIASSDGSSSFASPASGVGRCMARFQLMTSWAAFTCRVAIKAALDMAGYIPSGAGW
jgi:hypothetical protein